MHILNVLLAVIERPVPVQFQDFVAKSASNLPFIFYWRQLIEVQLHKTSSQGTHTNEFGQRKGVKYFTFIAFSVAFNSCC